MKRLSFLASAFLAAAFLGILTSCSSIPLERRELLEDLAVPAEKLARGVCSRENDLPHLQEATLCLLEALADKYGADAVRDLQEIGSPEEFGAYLAVRHGTTAYQEALDAFRRWDRNSRTPRWKEKKLDRLETEHFIVVSMPGTPGFRDREYIAELLESQLDAIRGLLKPTPAMEERFAANMAVLEGGRVTVIVPPDTRAFPGFEDTANMNWGFRVDGDRLDVEASIRLPYYNALSAYILAHEETHLLDIFYKLDLDSAPPLPERGDNFQEFVQALKVWTEDVFSRILPNDTAFGEGIAEYAAREISPMHRIFLGDPAEALRVMHRTVPPIPDILASSPSVKERSVRIVRYTELHSLVRYLIEEYGPDRFLEFYGEVPFSEEKFRKAYGMGFSAAQEEWRASCGIPNG